MHKLRRTFATKSAHWIKFIIPLPFLAAGLLAMMVMPFWSGAAVALVLIFIGGGLAAFTFKRLATPEQIKADLKARLDSD